MWCGAQLGHGRRRDPRDRVVLQDVLVRCFPSPIASLRILWLTLHVGDGVYVVCSECLDRRRAKKESKEKARVLRETAKLERDAKKQRDKQLKEELLARKSAEAIEHKAKRVLEMQDRILSRKKVKYKDKEEETLGKLAEDVAQTVRYAKERLEKLEKEDVSLRKKVRWKA